MDETTTCTLCDATPSTSRPAVLWAMGVSDGVREYYCTPCARANVERFEGRADPSSFWSAA